MLGQTYSNSLGKTRKASEGLNQFYTSFGKQIFEVIVIYCEFNENYYLIRNYDKNERDFDIIFFSLWQMSCHLPTAVDYRWLTAGTADQKSMGSNFWSYFPKTFLEKPFSI